MKIPERQQKIEALLAASKEIYLAAVFNSNPKTRDQLKQQAQRLGLLAAEQMDGLKPGKISV